MKLLTLATVSINLISFLWGVPYHTPIEIDSTHAIYAQTMIVCDTYVDDKGTTTIEDDSGEIYFTDGNGDLWIYEEYPEDYYVGDYVAVLFDDNGTPETIYDDVILDIRATGFVRKE